MKKILALAGLLGLNVALLWLLLTYGFSSGNSSVQPKETTKTKVVNEQPSSTPSETPQDKATVVTAPPTAKTYLSTFVGKVDKINGDQWYVIETTYTRLYMHHTSTEFAWLSTELDQMVDFYLTFMNETWTRKDKLDIYLPDDLTILRTLKEHKGAYYTPDPDAIFFHPDALAFESDGKKTDIRFILMHELTHGIDRVEHTSTANLWLEESFATYMAYMYPYQDRSSDTNRIIIPFQNFYYQPRTFVNPSRELLDYVKRNNWATEEQQKRLVSLEGLNDYHYGKMTLSIDFDTTVLEASVTDYLVSTYGQRKTVALLTHYRHPKKGETIDDILQAELGVNKVELNTSWQHYIE